MNIKLNARLSAYSKFTEGSHDDCEHDIVTKQDIDDLFNDIDDCSTNVVTNDQIDDLFINNNSSDEVTKQDIDDLFR